MGEPGGLRLGRVVGVEVVIDPSWAVIALLVTWLLRLEFGKAGGALSGSGEVIVWGAAAGASALFFGSVLVHELSHSLVAIRRGISVRRIRLFIFGGVSEIEEEAATPGDEFRIAAAGPLASFALAGAFYLLAELAPPGWIVVTTVSGWLALINLALGIFNLLPGFPLDGGRVLRAAVWRATGSLPRATRVAVAGGRLLASLLVLAGLVVLFLMQDLAGLWYVALGWFLYRAAGASLVHMRLRGALAGVRAGQLMTPTPPAVPGDVSLQEFFDRYQMGGGRSTFPVVVNGRVRGLVGLEQLRSVSRSEWPSVPVGALMRPLGPEDVVSADEPAERLLVRLAGGDREVVVVRDGRVVGLITHRDVAGWLRTPPPG